MSDFYETRDPRLKELDKQIWELRDKMWILQKEETKITEEILKNTANKTLAAKQLGMTIKQTYNLAYKLEYKDLK